MNRKMAVCDPEKEYVRHLMEYVNSKNKLRFKAAAFTSAEMLKKYLNENCIDMVLINEMLIDEALMEIKTGKIICLTEDETMDDTENWQGLKKVYKYQSADKLLKEVMSCYEAQKIACLGEDPKGKQIIGVFSPAADIRKNIFTIELGKILAEKRNVLYICMEGFVDIRSVVRDEGFTADERGLSELLYYFRRNDCFVGEKLRSLISTTGELDIINAPFCVEDIQEIKPAEWEMLCRKLMKESIYDVLLLDIGCEICGLMSILRLCDRVYIPQIDNEWAEGKFESLMNQLSKKGIKADVKYLGAELFEGDYNAAESLQERLSNFIRGRCIGELQ